MHYSCVLYSYSFSNNRLFYFRTVCNLYSTIKSSNPDESRLLVRPLELSVKVDCYGTEVTQSSFILFSKKEKEIKENASAWLLGPITGSDCPTCPFSGIPGPILHNVTTVVTRLSTNKRNFPCSPDSWTRKKKKQCQGLDSLA